MENLETFGFLVFSGSMHRKGQKWVTQPAITCSKLTTETLEQGVKHVQKWVNF